MEKRKKTSPQEPLRYLTGNPVDDRAWVSALKVFLSTFALLLAFLIAGSMLMLNNMILRWGLNLAMLLLAWTIYWQAGVSAGTGAANLGEILYQRQATGRDVDEKERRRAFHKAKGFIVGLLGCVPIFLCALILALTAQRVMTTAGILPTWLEPLERREEIGGALAAYHQAFSMTVTDVMRLIIRMALMPLVNIVGVEDKAGLLMIERLSPLLVLIPGLCYGVGYLGGVGVRERIHADIEAGKRRTKRRQKREIEQKKRERREPQGPGQLN